MKQTETLAREKHVQKFQASSNCKHTPLALDGSCFSSVLAKNGDFENCQAKLPPDVKHSSTETCMTDVL